MQLSRRLASLPSSPRVARARRVARSRRFRIGLNAAFVTGALAAAALTATHFVHSGWPLANADPVLVVPTSADVQHYQRELAAEGIVLGAEVVTFNWLVRGIAARSTRELADAILEQGPARGLSNELSGTRGSISTNEGRLEVVHTRRAALGGS